VIEALEPNEIFVFGSNTAGRHGAGAALDARQRFGAQWGVAQGLTGQAYALPTASFDGAALGAKRFPALPLEAIEQNLAQLAEDAKTDPGKHFLLTRIGMGRSGYSEQQIRPLIEAAQLPSNVKPYWEWESGGGGGGGGGANRVLFGGLPGQVGSPPAEGVNRYGNDWKATEVLSNMAMLASPISYGGVDFPSVEHAFQAAKFEDDGVRRLFAGLSSASDAKFLGSRRGSSQWQSRLGVPAMGLRADWNEVKGGILNELVEQKFRNNPEMLNYLLSTGDAELIENATGWRDQEYGMVDPFASGGVADPARLVGKNMTGMAVMRARERLAPEQPAAVVNPTGQQVADGVQLKLDLEGQQTQEDPKRKAGDLLPWLLAAGGTGLAAYALAEALNRDNPGAQVPAPLV
jgi:predicted NAD-dependent protein-ADP-ribosyltransferase YbiA (DUF1768 family)